ncbi:MULTISPECIES: DUF6461 domain-containing protein [unclassified Streptomyces]|uniref:DUF6461 domain-containing protein n=1 Tax=unclassified Streptomyces TaxID=2593676 RepID=UPI001661F7CC|nr:MULTISPECIES: DUF6461 domain-containing protein [unclassified Streptomyces]MBD0837912.1 hypothetical protein [Streptomyces sp. TRM68416]
MNGITTAADYTWLGTEYEDLMEAYCVTYVRGLTAEELLQELNAEPAGWLTGVDTLCEPAYELSDHDRLFVGAATLGDWTLMVEPNGYLGTLDEIMLPLSRGRRVVSHFRNVNAVDHFNWWEDGTLRLHFEPLFAYARDGSHPDGLLAEMKESGFDLSDAEDRAEDFDLIDEAAFALAHRITGIRVTPALFASAEFVCGVAPVPHS